MSAAREAWLRQQLGTDLDRIDERDPIGEQIAEIKRRAAVLSRQARSACQARSGLLMELAWCMSRRGPL